MTLQRAETTVVPRRRASDVSQAALHAGVHPNSPANKPAFSLDLVRSLRMHRGLAAGIAFAGLALAGIFLLVVHPVYTAQSLIDVHSEPAQVADSQSGVSSPSEPNTYESHFQTQVSTVTRHDVLAAAIRRLDGDEWLREGESEQAAAERLGRALQVARAGNSEQIAVTATAASPDSAAHLANAVAESFIEAARRDEKAGDAERLTMLREERDRIGTQLAVERAEQETLNKQPGAPSAGSPVPDSQLDQIDQARAELIKARTAHDQAIARLISLDAGKDASSASLDGEANASIANDAGLNRIRASLNQRRAALIAHMANLTPNHPQYQQDAQELVQIDNSLNSMVKEMRARAGALMEQRLRTELEQASDLETKLNAQLGRLIAAEAGAAPRLQRSNDLAADILRLQQSFATVDAQFRNRSLEDAASGSVHLAAAAVPSLHPAQSERTRTALIIAIAGLLLGVIAAVVVQRLDTRVYIPADVERVIGFAPMGILPEMGEVSSAVADEHFQRLAAAIDQAHQQGTLTSCILTGTGPGAGVTTVATRVKAILNAMGKQTELVDASAAQSSLPPGPSAAESRDAASHRATQRYTRPTRIHLKMGDEPREQSLVLTDAAPLPVSAETEYLVRHADAVIVVIESGRTTRAQLRDAATALERLNVAAVGFVLNRARLRTATSDFRASVRAMEAYLRAQNRARAARSESTESIPAAVPAPAEQDRPVSMLEAPADSEMPTAGAEVLDGPPAYRVLRADSAQGGPMSAEETVLSLAAAASRLSPQGGPEWKAFLAEAERILAHALQSSEVQTAVNSPMPAPSGSPAVPSEWEQIMPNSRRTTPAERSVQAAFSTANGTPWWLTDPSAEPDPPQFVASSRATSPAEPPASEPPVPAASEPEKDTQEIPAYMRQVRFWEDVPVLPGEIGPEPTTQDVLAREQGEHPGNLASRLSTLKNLSILLGRQRPEISADPEAHEGFESQAIEPQSKPFEFASAFPSVSDVPEADAEAAGAPQRVTAAAEILSPRTTADGPAAEPQETRIGPSGRGLWEASDDDLTLPSWRGQYKRKE
jgi:uncharacterized protein involved in exopolysaccharide biosynthesis/Mrp family chromosome partitioning ATPase